MHFFFKPFTCHAKNFNFHQKCSFVNRWINNPFFDRFINWLTYWFSKFTKKNEDWLKIHYLIIDEVLMVGYTMLTKIHFKLQKLKSSALQLFGGLIINFLGVFVQFPPISDTPLYTSNIKPPLTFTKQTQKEKIIGKVYGKTM